MKNYAQLLGNSVVNIIVADNKDEVEQLFSCTLVEITAENPAGIGYAYDAETGLFINPNPVVEEFPEQIPAE